MHIIVLTVVTNIFFLFRFIGAFLDESLKSNYFSLYIAVRMLQVWLCEFLIWSAYTAFMIMHTWKLRKQYLTRTNSMDSQPVVLIESDENTNTLSGHLSRSNETLQYQSELHTDSISSIQERESRNTLHSERRDPRFRAPSPARNN